VCDGLDDSSKLAFYQACEYQDWYSKPAGAVLFWKNEGAILLAIHTECEAEPRPEPPTVRQPKIGDARRPNPWALGPWGREGPVTEGQKFAYLEFQAGWRRHPGGNPYIIVPPKRLGREELRT
jgi:hypothetical protein